VCVSGVGPPQSEAAGKVLVHLASVAGMSYEENDDDDVMGSGIAVESLANGGLVETKRKIKSTEPVERSDYLGSSNPSKLGISTAVSAKQARFDHSSYTNQNYVSSSKRKEVGTWNNVEEYAGKYMYTIISNSACPWGTSAFELMELEAREFDENFDFYDCNRSFLGKRSKGQVGVGANKAGTLNPSSRGARVSPVETVAPLPQPAIPLRRNVSETTSLTAESELRPSTTEQTADNSSIQGGDSPFSSWFDIAAESSKSFILTWCPKADLKDAASKGKLDSGACVDQNVKLYIEWLIAPSKEEGTDRRSSKKHLQSRSLSSPAQDSEPDADSPVDNEAHTLEIGCNIRYCKNIVSVPTSVIELGECNIGEFKTATLMIRYILFTITEATIL
jgi:hypothetical protein